MPRALRISCRICLACSRKFQEILSATLRRWKTARFQSPARSNRGAPKLIASTFQIGIAAPANRYSARAVNDRKVRMADNSPSISLHRAGRTGLRKLHRGTPPATSDGIGLCADILFILSARSALHFPGQAGRHGMAWPQTPHRSKGWRAVGNSDVDCHSDRRRAAVRRRQTGQCLLLDKY